jgi:hypothetical protein
MKITAYIAGHQITDIHLPDKKRKWMDDTPNGFAYRCLPLTVANGFGWTFVCPYKFAARWNGNNDIGAVKFNFFGKPEIALSHFGSGIITMHTGYLMKTDPGINLYVKGPANNPKRGVSPLEGMVETDWLPFTFTMNWKITESNYDVIFEEGEPFCTIFPYQRNFIEQFDPRIESLENDPEFNQKYREWADSRKHYNAHLKENGNKGERDYLRGIYKDGQKFHDHQTNIKAKPFEKCLDNCCVDENGMV